MKVANISRCVLFVMAAVASISAQARFWHGLKDASPVSGSAIADKDLLGKIVLVYCFNADTVDVEVLKRAETLYGKYDRSRFAVVGACRDETGIAALAGKHGVTFPVYKDFRLVTCLEKAPGTLYFSNEYGRLVWQAGDAASRRDLEKALVKEIARCGKPPSLTDGAVFGRYAAIKDKLVLGHPDIPSLVKNLGEDAEARSILAAIGRGREETVANIRVLMDYNGVAAYEFLGLYLKSFPGDKPKYAKLYEELEARAARESRHQGK